MWHVCPMYTGRYANIGFPNGKTWRPRHFVNCKTQGIVYMFICPCGAFYIGKTKHEFRKRMQGHFNAAILGNIDSPIGKHVALFHYYKVPDFKFMALNRIHPNRRGGDWDKMLLKCESRWIFEQKVCNSPSFNDIISSIFLYILFMYSPCWMWWCLPRLYPFEHLWRRFLHLLKVLSSPFSFKVLTKFMYPIFVSMSYRTYMLQYYCMGMWSFAYILILSF